MKSWVIIVKTYRVPTCKSKHSKVHTQHDNTLKSPTEVNPTSAGTGSLPNSFSAWAFLMVSLHSVHTHGFWELQEIAMLSERERKPWPGICFSLQRWLRDAHLVLADEDVAPHEENSSSSTAPPKCYMSFLTGVTMAVVNKTRNNECSWGRGEKGTFRHCWWECKSVRSWRKIAWSFLKKLRAELPCDPATALLCGYQKKANVPNQKDLCIRCWPQCYSRWPGLETTQVIFDTGLDREAAAGRHTGTWPSPKRRGDRAICEEMDGPSTYRAKRHKSGGRKCEPYYFTDNMGSKAESDKCTRL